MNQANYAKYSNTQGFKEYDMAARRPKAARESEPPMMSNNSMFQKPSQVDAYKAKQSQPFDPLGRLNGKYTVQVGNADKVGQPTIRSAIGYRGVEQNTPKKDDSHTTTNQQNLKGQTNPRFMSPELKYVPAMGQKPHQRKYSTQTNDFSYNSKSITHLPSSSNDYNLHRTHTDSFHAHGNSSGGRLPPNSSSPVGPPKRQPRYSQPANFSMDMMEDSNEPSVGSFHAQDDSKLLAKLKEPQKIPAVLLPTPLSSLGGKQNNTVTSAFRKEKELKETVSTHSTFNSMEEAPRVFTRMDTKQSQHSYSSHNSKKTPDNLKLSDFIKGKQIGSGKFGSVFIVKHKATGFVCALKAIPKDIIKEQNILNQLTRQLKIQMYLDHPNIVKLYGFFHDKDNIYLLLELGSSGQLYKVIKDKERLSQASTSYCIKQVCEAVRYLHCYKIIHRDLKPQNIVIQSGTVKLCDFGWAVARGSELRSTFCGTPLYVSPQILKGQHYDEKIDLWSIGILTFELLFGNIPFEINREEELIKIIKQDIKFPKHIPASDDAKDFILKILKKNPNERLKIDELLEHPFLKKCPQFAPELEF